MALTPRSDRLSLCSRPHTSFAHLLHGEDTLLCTSSQCGFFPLAKYFLAILPALLAAPLTAADRTLQLAPSTRDMDVAGARCVTLEVFEDRSTEWCAEIHLEVVVVPSLGRRTEPDPRGTDLPSATSLRCSRSYFGWGGADSDSPATPHGRGCRPRLQSDAERLPN